MGHINIFIYRVEEKIGDRKIFLQRKGQNAYDIQFFLDDVLSVEFLYFFFNLNGTSCISLQLLIEFGIANAQIPSIAWGIFYCYFCKSDINLLYYIHLQTLMNIVIFDQKIFSWFHIIFSLCNYKIFFKQYLAPLNTSSTKFSSRKYIN